MSQAKYYTTMTETGKSLLAKAAVSGEKVDVLHFAIGDGGGAYYQPSASDTELKHEVWRGPVSKYEVNPRSPNVITITGVVPATVGGFFIRECAVIEAEGRTIALSNYPDTPKIVLEEGAPGDMEIRLEVLFSDADSISFTIDPTVVIAVKEDIREHDKSPKAHQGLLSGHEIRIKRLEDALYNDVGKNPFLITFVDLAGVTLTEGIWNRAAARLEC